MQNGTEKIKIKMLKTLILYSSTDGHTKKICERISSNVNKVLNVDLKPLNSLEDNTLQEYEQIIIGASIRYGKHNPRVYKFIENNLDYLEKNKSSFFSVNLVARKKGKNTPETNPYIKKFLSISKWKPKNMAVFAGKIDYQKYGLVDKYMIKLIMWIGKGPTDIKGVYEFTDWTEVDRFSQKLI